MWIFELLRIRLRRYTWFSLSWQVENCDQRWPVHANPARFGRKLRKMLTTVACTVGPSLPVPSGTQLELPNSLPIISHSAFTSPVTYAPCKFHACNWVAEVVRWSVSSVY